MVTQSDRELARAQIMNYEQFLIALWVYSETKDLKLSEGNLLDLQRNIAHVVNNRLLDTRRFPNESAVKIASDADVFPEADDPIWQSAMKSVLPTSGAPFRMQGATSYSGTGMRGLNEAKTGERAWEYEMNEVKFQKSV